MVREQSKHYIQYVQSAVRTSMCISARQVGAPLIRIHIFCDAGTSIFCFFLRYSCDELLLMNEFWRNVHYLCNSTHAPAVLCRSCILLRIILILSNVLYKGPSRERSPPPPHSFAQMDTYSHRRLRQKTND
jgi:hypothetical protein